jgi:hypothetical protein
MAELEAQRTLVKSPPELWTELSEPTALARLLETQFSEIQFGEIQITRARPQTSLEWSGPLASGSVELEPSGWGTKVRITAQLDLIGGTDQADLKLEHVLDEIGSARHRPFSR